MMVVIDRARQIVVDKATFDEVRGAFAFDLDAATVEIVEKTSAGEVHTTRHCPAGLRVIARYPR